MPRNVDIARAAGEAFNRGDAEATSALFDPDAEFVPLLARLEGRVYRGPEGVKQWMAELDHDWEFFEVVHEEFRDLGDLVLILGSWRARARTSGVELDSAPAAWIGEFRSGRIVRWETFTDREEAFRAAGIQDP